MTEKSGERKLLDYLRDVIYKPQSAKLDAEELPANLRTLGEGLLFLGECVQQADAFAKRLGEGDIHAEPPGVENALASPLKTIQSNLRHLAWVTQRVSAGDYNQEVDFMGDFSVAFNSMVKQLDTQKKLLEKDAYTDEGTGAWNRRYAGIILPKLWAEGRAITLALVDVDRLKNCNDTYGYVEGDRYILSVYQMLADYFQDGNYIFRMNGDEFLILSEEMPQTKMEGLLEAAREQYIGTYADLVEYPRSFSYGCVSADPKQNITYRRYITEAEQKMYNYRFARMDPEKKTGTAEELGIQLDEEGLGGRVFDAFAASSGERYLYLCNLKTNVSRWSKSAVEQFNLPGEYIYDAINVWAGCIHPDDRDAVVQDISATLTGHKDHHEATYRVKNSKGQYVLCTCKGFMITGGENKPDLFAGTIINHGAIDNIDAVTNLYNMYELMDVLRKYKQDGRPLNLLLVDVNEFRRINSSYGYDCGNQVLKQFGQKLRDLIGGKGTVFRYIGAKFVLLTEPADYQNTRRLFRAVDDIARNLLYVNDTRIGLTVSGGAVSFSRLDVDESTALTEVEYALSTSKKEGHKMLVYFDDSLHSNARRQLEMIDTIIQSVLFNDFHGFYLEYQPQVRPDGTIIGVEALIRWKDEEWGVIPPGEFIPILENDRCFYDLGLWVLQTALRNVKPLVQMYPDFTVSVNVSYRQLERQEFKSDVITAVNKLNFPPKNLILELTEHCHSLQQEVLEENLNFLKAQGIRIAADDFGTGYSSFVMLRDLPFDCIKMDQVFVKDIVENEPDQIILRTTIQCAKDFGISVCVEGVEDPETLGVIQEYQPNTYQGYLFSRPIPLEYVEKLLRQPGGPKIEITN